MHLHALPSRGLTTQVSALFAISGVFTSERTLSTGLAVSITMPRFALVGYTGAGDVVEAPPTRTVLQVTYAGARVKIPYESIWTVLALAAFTGTRFCAEGLARRARK